MPYYFIFELLVFTEKYTTTTTTWFREEKSTKLIVTNIPGNKYCLIHFSVKTPLHQLNKRIQYQPSIEVFSLLQPQKDGDSYSFRKKNREWLEEEEEEYIYFLIFKKEGKENHNTAKCNILI